MTEETENLVLEMLRNIRGTIDRMALDIMDLKIRMSAVETHLGQHQLQLAAMNTRMDHVDERLSRIERRLDLVSA